MYSPDLKLVPKTCVFGTPFPAEKPANGTCLQTCSDRLPEALLVEPGEATPVIGDPPGS
jgi:hypothetical protein